MEQKNTQRPKVLAPKLNQNSTNFSEGWQQSFKELWRNVNEKMDWCKFLNVKDEKAKENWIWILPHFYGISIWNFLHFLTDEKKCGKIQISRIFCIEYHQIFRQFFEITFFQLPSESSLWSTRTGFEWQDLWTCQSWALWVAWTSPLMDCGRLCSFWRGFRSGQQRRKSKSCKNFS